MNKSFIFLALASFALLSCSDEEKEKTHADFCASGPTRECLIGKWSFGNIEGEGSSCTPNGGILILNADGTFEAESIGRWELTGKGMKITCTVSCKDVQEEPYEVTLKLQGSNLKITNEGFPSFFGDCKSNKVSFTEVYYWYGPN